MKIMFLGAAHEVTGSCTLLYAAGKKILVDFGMEQGADIYENADMPVAPSDIDCVLLTHAHIDHSGKLPLLVANGYKGPIMASAATTKLCEIMLMDSAHIQEFEASWKSRKAKRSGEGTYKPMYTSDDVCLAMTHFKSCDYGKTYRVCAGVTAKFIDAGHLLGSSSIEITATENGETKTILFSGDIGNRQRPLLRDPEQPNGADYVVIESTYGDRVHSDRPDYIKYLSETAESTFAKGGNVVIPSFAVGRTQELLYLFREIKEKNLVKSCPDFTVWVDSPLAVEATKLYSGRDEDMLPYYDKETLDLIASGRDVLDFPGLRVAVTSDESKAINFDKSPKVIISASGMCEAGRIRHHLKHNLWRSECTVLFVGYQSEGTLGRALLEGAEEVRLFGEEVLVRANIVRMEGISAHADKNMLVDWLRGMKVKPKKVFVNHGSDKVCDIFASEVTSSLGLASDAPYSGSVYDLDDGGRMIERGNTSVKEKTPASKKSNRTSAEFEKLLMAGNRLMSVIEHNRGGANKDLSKFTNMINELCKKWDR